MYKNQYKNVKEYMKRRKGIITIKNILIIFALLLLCISIGYSYHNTSLKIRGTVLAKSNIISYTIAFHPNNGGPDNYKTQTFISGVSQKLAANTFENGTLDFKKWTTNSNGTGEVYTDEQQITDELANIDGEIIDLYAQWGEREYWVTYNFGNEQFMGANYINTDIGLFNEKNINRDFEISMDVSNFTYLTGQENNRNVLLCNQNEKDSPYQGFAFQYRDNSLKIQVNCNKLPNVQKEWNKTEGTIIFTRTDDKLYQDNTTLLYDFNNGITAFAAPLTIGANVDTKLQPRRYCCADISNIKIKMKYEYDELDELINNLPTPHRTYYRFLGWYTAAEGGTQVTPETSVSQSEIMLYPHWEKESDYTVKFNGNGGTGTMADQIFGFDELKALSKNKYTKEGYNFVGWSTNKNGTGNRYSDQQVVINVEIPTLYAQWLLIPKNEFICTEPITFDGKYTSIIDTGVYLFNSENIHKNFEIHFEIDSIGDNTINQPTLLNAKDESGVPYPGIVFRIDKSKFLLKADTDSKNSKLVNNQIESVEKVRLIRINDIVYYSINDADFEVLMDFSNFTGTFDAPVSFGGLIRPDGSRDRGFKGTISNMYVGFIDDNATLEDYE